MYGLDNGWVFRIVLDHAAQAHDLNVDASVEREAGAPLDVVDKLFATERTLRMGGKDG